MANIRVELQLNDGSFTSGMLRAGQSISSFQKELSRLDPHFRKISQSGYGAITSVQRLDTTNRSLLGTLRDVSIVAGGVALAFRAMTGASSGLIGSIVKINADMERLRFQMTSLSQAADPIREAADQVSYLRDMATKVPFSLKELSTTFVKLRTTGIDPTQKAMAALTDGIAAFGGTDEQLHRVTLGIQQMSGKSVIQMEEMRQQLSESMPSAMQTMARSMGVSVAELVQAISTGRVQAKPALDAFYSELDRTYGGTAQMMMKTFSGQITQMNANLQKLATGSGLGEFVNVTLKNLVEQFNSFLRSSDAKQLADKFGQALSGIVNRFHTVARVMYEFRSEIVLMGKALVAAFAVGAIRSGVTAIGTMITGLRVSMLSVQAEAGRTAIALHTVGLRARSGAGGILVLSAAVRAAGVGIRAAAVSVAVAAPAIAALGAVVAIAAGSFGLFKNEVKDAYDELREFGVQSRTEAQRIIDAREQQILSELKTKEALLRRPGARNSNTRGAVQDLQDELAELQKNRERLITEAGQREDEENRRRLESQIADRTQAAQRIYREEIIELEKAQIEALELREESGRAQKEITEEYQRGMREAATKLYRSELDTLEGFAKSAKAAVAEASTEADRAAATATLDLVAEKISEVQKKLISVKTTFDGIDMGPALESPEEKMKRATRELENLTRDVKNLEAEFRGSDGAVAEMLYRIERGDFGSIEEGIEATRDLHEALVEATAQKEILNELMKGRRAIESDLDRANQRAVEKEMELRERATGQQLSDADKIQLRLESGFYKGLGPAEMVRASITRIIETMNVQGNVLNELARVMQGNTFGDPTVNKIQSVEQAVRSLNGALGLLGGGLGDISFGNFAAKSVASGMSLPGSAGNGFLDFVAKYESGSASYNATLDNGRWTGGPKDLVSMTLNEIRELQRMMLANPENRMMYGQGKGSSALGRYQIVGKTLAGLIEEMGLTGNELFDPAMQDAMALRLANRRGGNPAALRQEWEGLNKASDAEIMAAWGQGSVQSQPSAPSFNPVFSDDALKRIESEAAAQTAKMYDEIAKLRRQEDINLTEEQRLIRKETLEELQAATVAAQSGTGDLGANYQRLLEAIQGGKLGDDRSPDAEIYAELIAAAKELDRVERDATERKRAMTQSDRERVDLERQRVDLNRQIAEAQAGMNDPNYSGQTAEMTRLNSQLDEYLDNVRRAYGEDSREYQQALNTKSNMLTQQVQLDELTARSSLVKQARDASESNMTRYQQAKMMRERDLLAIDAHVEKMRAAGMAEIEITAFVEEQKKAVRDRYASELNPLEAQFDKWLDLQGNLTSKTTAWTDGLATGISGLIQGTGSLKSVIDGMLNDVVNMGVRWVMGAMGSKAGGKGGKAAPTKSVGVKHGGGIVGAKSRIARNVSIGTFSNAPIYHTGGIVGTKLGKNERPIIAEDGEGVFTEEQMAAMAPISSMANNQAFSINAPISVNGSAGTPDQNTDLAKKMAREMENSMRGVVLDELRRATRPGNMLASR